MKVKIASIVFSIGLILAACKTAQQPAEEITKNAAAVITTDGLDPVTGLHLDENLVFVQAHCTSCHSSKLITSNRFTREGWKEKIVWMQKTQNLWDLGEAEPKVLDYLAKYYAPEDRPLRRQPLDVKEWYKLNL